MTIEEIRRENMRWLAQQCESRKKFAELLEVDEARVSQLIGKNPSKVIGTPTARKIERVFSRPKGWLDMPNAWTGESNGVRSVVIAEDIAKLIVLFGQSTDDGRTQILRAAELADKLGAVDVDPTD